MFLIGLGFTPRMTCCNWLLGAIIVYIYSTKHRTYKSPSKNAKKNFFKNYETFNISRHILLKNTTNTFIIVGKSYPSVFYSKIVIPCLVP